MASVVKSSTLVSKDLRDQLPNVIKSAVEKDSLTAEETAALGYLLDELNGKHVEDKKNSHAIHEYNKRFADMPELLEQADKKLKESSVTVTPAAEKTYIEEEAEELPKNRRQEDKKGYSKEEIKEAKIKKDKDKTLRDWIILKSDIENNPNMSDGQKAYAIKSLIDQARTYKMTDPKKTTDEELKDADEFMQEFGYDYDKKGRASTNPIARKWKDAIDKRIKEQEQDRGRGGPTIIPVVIPHGNEGNDNVVVPSDDKGNENITPSDDKKKKGLFGWIGEKAKKAWDWTKRNARKVALIGTVALLGLLGTKSCENGEKDDVKKDNPEYVAPAPTPEKDTESKDTIDLAMAHQYCKRMGYQDSMSQEDAIAKYLMDRETYSSVKDKYAYHMGFDKNTSIDEQMAILATVRGNTPKDAPVIDAILNARDVNIASVAKLKPETAKFVVNQENGTIQYRNPEEFTKQTGTQSIEVSKDKLTQQAENLGFVVQAKGGNTH